MKAEHSLESIDPNRMGIEDASSGGRMSLLQAMSGRDGDPLAADPIDPVSSRLQAAAVFFPLTDLLNYGAPGAVQCGDLGPLEHHGGQPWPDFWRQDGSQLADRFDGFLK